jgi:hypothetical protein
VEHDQQLNGSHVTMDTMKIKSKIVEFGTPLVDGGGMSPPGI